MRRYRRTLVVIVAALIVSAMVLTLMLGTARADSHLPANLHTEVSHVAISRNGDGLAVAYMATVVNSGTGPSPEFVIPIPAEATNFELLEGAAKVTRNGEQVMVPGGIAAGGSSSIGFRYMLPAGITEVHYPDIPPADMAMLLVDEATLTMTTVGPGLSDKGVVVLGPKAYRQFIVTRPAPGMNLSVQLKLEGNPANAEAAINAAGRLPAGAPVDQAPAESRLLNQSFHGGNANVMLWQRMTGSTGHGGLMGLLLMGLLLLGLVLGAVFLLARRRQAAAAVHAPPVSTRGRATREAASLQKRKAQLARRIAEIDRTPEAERTPELDEERAAVKAQLVDVIMHLRRVETHAD
ncbi:MAG: hypothetical protein ACOY94_26255 [Bacillota bacterium]